jgi:DNA-binding IscR family transcriptional regulator
MYIISQSVPFTPNSAKLSERMGVPRNSVLKIFDLLHKAKIVSLLRGDTNG